MATSHYFNNYAATKINEVQLYEDVLIESIKIMGHDVWYMPRENWNENDNIFGENVQSKFDRAYLMEMYLANVQGWEGDGELFTKFGLELRQGTNLVVAKRTFNKYMPTSITPRPREGDLIYVPVMQQLFEIKFVEEELLFFARGYRYPYIFELRCEVFRYSSEQINTGVDQIDQVDQNATYTVVLDVSGTGNFNIGEMVYQGANLTSSTASAKVADWDPNNKKLNLYHIKGEFSQSASLKSTDTNLTFTITSTDTLGDNVYYDLFDNKQLQDEANTIMVLQSNPFGNP